MAIEIVDLPINNYNSMLRNSIVLLDYQRVNPQSPASHDPHLQLLPQHSPLWWGDGLTKRWEWALMFTHKISFQWENTKIMCIEELDSIRHGSLPSNLFKKHHILSAQGIGHPEESKRQLLWLCDATSADKNVPCSSPPSGLGAIPSPPGLPRRGSLKELLKA